MKNPFKKEGYMLPIASINSAYVDDMLVSDLFKLSLITETILAFKDDLGIVNVNEDQSLLETFNECLVSDIGVIREKAYQIALDYGDRLARILSMFFKPSIMSKKNRDNWDDEHWNYWKQIKQVYLVGGITSPILTRIFYEQIMKEFEDKGIHKKVEFMIGSQNLGTKGLTTLVDNQSALLFDFGQTRIKRAYYRFDANSTIDIVLPTLKSKYLFYKHQGDTELINLANRLHQYIVDVIVKTAIEVDFDGDTMIVAIANYVYKGQIYKQRGGYGKLALLCKKYDAMLSTDVSQKLNKNIKIKLFHDTSAMALNFCDKTNTAVISIGTAFGIAFVD